MWNLALREKTNYKINRQEKSVFIKALSSKKFQDIGKISLTIFYCSMITLSK